MVARNIVLKIIFTALKVFAKPILKNVIIIYYFYNFVFCFKEILMQKFFVWIIKVLVLLIFQHCFLIKKLIFVEEI